MESAVARPRNLYLYGGVTSIAALAVGLAVGIARNHPFEQGNKRTAFSAAVDFLFVNGYELTFADNEALGVVLEAVLTGEVTEAEFSAYLASGLQPTDGG